MFITEYDQEKAFAEQRADAREEGFEIGFEIGFVIGTVKTLISLVKDGLLSISQAAEEANMSVAEFKLQMEQG